MGDASCWESLMGARGFNRILTLFPYTVPQVQVHAPMEYIICVTCATPVKKNRSLFLNVFLNTSSARIEGKTNVINTEWKCKKSERWAEVCAEKRGGKGAEKWNKNRLMMELVSRWGSPLTSQAPHSLAYPSPVNRRGDTTDLSQPAKSSSGEPTALPPSHPFPLSFFIPDRKENKLKLCNDRATLVTLPEEERSLQASIYGF